MADIAREAGVSQGLAYRYFASKEAMLTTLVMQASEEGGGFRARLGAVPGSPGQKLYLIISNVLDARRREPEYYQLLYQALSDERISKELREVLMKSGAEVRAGLKWLIIEGQKTGEVHDDDPDQLAGTVLACLDGLSRGMLPLNAREARASLPDARVIARMVLKAPVEARRR